MPELAAVKESFAHSENTSAKLSLTQVEDLAAFKPHVVAHGMRPRKVPSRRIILKSYVMRPERGSVKVKTLPFPGSLSTQILPPCNSTII